MPGPTLVGPGRFGSKGYVLIAPVDLPLLVGSLLVDTTGAVALTPLVMAVPVIRSHCGLRRRTPGKLHPVNAYDQAELRDWIHGCGIGVRVVRKDVESSEKPGRHR
ncbi:hypothetical protein GCM10010174_85520 [Kutzneria viridogrisea]|uniref:Uncharacterized protein n=2 Tax=Kutzneria TaxID=43356 RepID=W5WKS8_9PSEU|nr:hypothetical protein [Kutzneria albida]AHH98774.1 hypothetical protein KALB_5412 [Kutzneria albida DSM 43870]MBA8923716.1 hypothetical protein [Kutzneria viridogrisea]